MSWELDQVQHLSWLLSCIHAASPLRLSNKDASGVHSATHYRQYLRHSVKPVREMPLPHSCFHSLLYLVVNVARSLIPSSPKEFNLQPVGCIQLLK